MPKLTRYLQKIFANNSNQVGVFGTGVDKETSKNVETLQSVDYEEGWSSAIITNKNYPIWQEMDGVQYGLSYQLKYLFQNGIPEWLSTETYYTNSYCRVGSNVYYSLQDDNTNHNPALNDGWWTPLLTSSRSIGEIVPSCVPLTEAGLHLLDGALIQGNGVYGDFVSYIGDLYNTTAKTYKPSAFTVVGSPTITSDGIASGISSSNYLTASGLTLGNDFEINIKFTTSSTLNVRQILYRASDSSFKFLLGINTSGNLYLSGIIEKSLMNLSANTSYTIRLVVKNNNCYTYVNNTLVDTTSVSVNYNALNFTIGVGSSGGDPFLGSIDLKEIVFQQSGIIILSGASVNGFCLESEWQQSVTNYGVCDKFVYEPSSNTVRLPKYNSKIYTGGGSASVKGNGMTLGLTDGTNLAGLYASDSERVYDLVANKNAYNSHVGSVKTASSITSKSLGVTTDSTKSGLIADLSDITTSLDCYYYIVVATTIKTDIEVDIDEIATDLNSKADVDLSNVNNQAKTLMASMGMPSNVYTNLTLGASGATYTAPANGYFAVSKVAGTNYYYVSIENQNSGIVDFREAYSTSYCTPCVAVKKNDVVKINYNATGTLNYFVFIYAKGAESEA